MGKCYERGVAFKGAKIPLSFEEETVRYDSWRQFLYDDGPWTTGWIEYKDL